MFIVRLLKRKRAFLSKAFKLFVAVTFLINQFAVFAMESTNYSISRMTQNYGSGYRISSHYQIPADAISMTPIDVSSSENYSIAGQSAIPLDRTMGAIIINDGDDFTNSVDVTLSLICSDPSGCDQMVLSNNGVGWTASEDYAVQRSWTMTSNDGKRYVYVKYKNGNGEWSGPIRDSITLDTEAPLTTISPVSGTYMEDPAIVLTASEPATIFYTTDGSEPTSQSSIYTGPIILTEDATIKCFSQDLAGNIGTEASETYMVCNGSGLTISGVVKDATMDKTVPLVVITLDTGQQATTNLNGAYAFTSLPRGYYRIESITAPSEGYVTYQKDLTLCKESVTHDIILTKKDALFGGDTFSGYSADSVNTGTGNFTFSETDLAIPGKGFSFSFSRTYNSQDDRDGPLGYGWTHNYNVGLTIEHDDEDAIASVTVRWGDGKAETWVPDGNGGYDPMPGVYDTLIENSDQTFAIKKKDLIEYHFDTSNRLEAIQDENGNAITFVYSGDNLDTIVDTAGRSVGYLYDAEGRITRILDPLERSVIFSYDVNGNLATSTDRNGNTSTYTYDTYHQLLTVTDPLGYVTVTNNYDAQRRVVSSQRDALGAETLYSYDVASKTTQIVDPDGNISYHHFDDLLRLIEEKDGLGYSATYEYNERGSLERVTDKNGNATTYQYDDNGNVLVKTDALGNTATATYDANDNPLTKTDANGNTTTFAYDPDGNLLSITDPLGNTTSYTYDASGQLLTTTDAPGNVTTHEYDHYGNRTAVTDAMGNSSSYGFDIVGRKISEIHPLGRAVAYEYDDMDNLISVTDALGGISEFAYDDNGNKIEHLDANGHKTEFAYDAKSRLKTRQTALNRIERYTYDSLDRRTAVTNPNGHTSTIVYDAVGNVTYETDAMNGRVSYEYDANGNRIATTDANNNRTAFEYDALNRLVSTTDALDNKLTSTYDPNGNRLSVTDALDQTTTYTYDELNRLVTVTDPLGQTTTNAYDALGRLATVTDPKGRQTRFEYDVLGRLVRVVDAAAGEVTATYDEIGNRTSVTDTRGNTKTYDYDVLNRLIAETDPLGNVVSMDYDAVGNLESLLDAYGATTYDYDADNRLTVITYPDGSTAAYTYDANSNRLSVVDSMGTTTYVYNVRDQLSSVTDPFGLTVSYTYDLNGNRSTIRYPGNKMVIYSFDPLNRLSRVTDWIGIQTVYAYDAAGRLTGQTMGNGAAVAYTYDDANRLIGKEDRTSGGDLIAGYSFTLDEVGNYLSINMDQPLIPQIGAIDKTFGHDAANQLVSSNDSIFEYDGKGNRTASISPAVTTQYAYDYNNRLTRVEDGTHIDEYQYNSDGHRLASTIDGIETRYLLDVNGGMENVLALVDDSNTVLTYYVYGDGLLYGVNPTTQQRLYYHYDAIGSTVAITDMAGSITDKYAYLPYGELNSSDTMNDNPFTYVGKYGVMQEQNGLYFMRARYYDPDTKQFISRDPLKGNMNNSQSVSPYVYVEGNPIKYIDPRGESILLGIAGLCLVAFNYVTLAIAIHEDPDFAPALSMGGHGPISVLEYDDEIYSAMKDMPTSFTGANGSSDSLIDYSVDQGTSVPDFATMEAKQDEIFINEKKAYNRATMTSAKSVNLLSGISSNSINLRPTVTKLNTTSSGNDNIERAPKEYLNVTKHASQYYRKEFAKLRDPDLLNKQTRSYIELRIASEINALQRKRYGYRSTKEEEKMRAQLRMNILNSGRKLYANLTQTLSKYAVLVGDLNKMPDFNSSNVNRRGVYAN